MNSRLCPLPLTALRTTAKHAPSITPPNHFQTLTTTCSIPSLSSLPANPPTWCTTAYVQSVMPFTLEKWVSCSWNTWMDTDPHLRMWTLTYWYLHIPNPTSSLFRIAGLPISYINSLVAPQAMSTTNLKWHINLPFSLDNLGINIHKYHPTSPPSPSPTATLVTFTSVTSVSLYSWWKPQCWMKILCVPWESVHISQVVTPYLTNFFSVKWVHYSVCRLL